jgi:hypothetical protein
MAPPITVDSWRLLGPGNVPPNARSDKLGSGRPRFTPAAEATTLPDQPTTAARQRPSHTLRGPSMAHLPITIACGNYDRTKAIIEAA